jgi:hypothetical protein
MRIVGIGSGKSHAETEHQPQGLKPTLFWGNLRGPKGPLFHVDIHSDIHGDIGLRDVLRSLLRF